VRAVLRGGLSGRPVGAVRQIDGSSHVRPGERGPSLCVASHKSNRAAAAPGPRTGALYIEQYVCVCRPRREVETAPRFV